MLSLNDDTYCLAIKSLLIFLHGLYIIGGLCSGLFATGIDLYSYLSVIYLGVFFQGHLRD